MAGLSTDLRAAIAFKRLSGLANTQSSLAYYNESIASQISIFSTEVMAERIDGDPSVAVSDGTVEFVEAELQQISGSNGYAYDIVFPSGYNGTFGSGAAGDPIRDHTQVVPQKIDFVFAESSNNGGYGYDLFDNGSRITPTDPRSWQVDPVAGILVSDDTKPPLNLGSGGTVRLYVYTGRFLNEALQETYSLTDERIVVADQDGNLQDFAELTFDGTTLTLDGALDTSGSATFGSTVTVQGGSQFDQAMNVDAQGTFDSLNVEDLTEDRIPVIGANGELEDDPNLTFDGTLLDLTGNQQISGTLDVGSATRITSQLDVDSANVRDLNDGGVVYAGSNGELQTEAGFEYDQSTDTLTVNTLDATNISGGSGTTISTLQVTDLTEDRIIIAGSGGELEDDPNFTFDGSTFNVSADQQITGTLDVDSQTTVSSLNVEDLTDGRVLLAGTSGEVEDSANLTFDGTVLNLTGNLQVSGTVDVDSQVTLSSANVEDLTEDRVLIAGSVGEIEDDGNFTFDGSLLNLTADQRIDTGHFHIESTYDDAATSVVPDSSQGARLMWIPEYAAYRSGRLTSATPSEWNESVIGLSSFAHGVDVQASGEGSVSMGRDNIVRGDFDSAFGDGHETGVGGNSSGWAFLAGFGNEVTDFVGTAIGWGNTAANVSTALGRGTDATGNYSFASNYFTEASNAFSTAMNYQTVASGNTSFAVGTETTASGNTSFAAGQSTEATGILSTAFGFQTDSTGLVSFGFGDESTVSGDFATVFGRGITVSGDYSFGISLDDLRFSPPNVSQSNTFSIMGGKVGIGLTNPVETFEVQGTMAVSGGGLLEALTKIDSLEVLDLTAGRVVFSETGSSGPHITDDAAFTYDDSTETLSVTNLDADNISSGGSGSTTLSTLNVTDLAQDRLVVTGVDGELEYDDNLQFDGSTFLIGSSTATTVDITGQLDVDNLRLNGNTLSSTNTDGNINLTPNGTGSVIINAADIGGGEIDNTPIGINSGANARFQDVTIDGNLTVQGTTTTVNTQTLSVADNVVTLNTDVSGVPVENAGIEVERGTATNATALWDETADVWKAGLNGSLYQILTENTVDNTTIEFSSGTLSVVDGSIGPTQLTNDSITIQANSGLGGGGTVPLGSSIGLNVNVDDSTIEIATDQLQIKDGGVTNAKLTNDSVTVSAGDGLQNGGSVALGSSVALDINPTDFAGSGLSAASNDLNVNVDGSTISITADTLGVPDGGITNAKLANPTIQINAGDRISGGGVVSLGNQITVSHEAITPSDVTLTGNQFISQVGFDNYGHVTSIVTRAVTTDDISEGSNNLYFEDERVDDRVSNLLVAGSNVSLSYDDSANTLTISSTDTDTNYTAGSGLDLSGTEFSHTDASTQGNVSTSSGTIIDQIDLDTFGHVTAIGTRTLDTDDIIEGSTNLYFTDGRAVSAVESGSDLNFSGNLTVNGSFGFDTGTTVNEIVDTISGSSSDQLVTENAIVSYLNNNYSTTSTADSDYVNVSGDTMTGALTVEDTVTVDALTVSDSNNLANDIQFINLPGDWRIFDTVTTNTFIQFQYTNDLFLVRGNSRLDGDVTVGDAYAGGSPPANGMLVEGDVSIGTPSSVNTLDLAGNMAVGSTYAANNAAPTDGLLVEGRTDVGDITIGGPAAQLTAYEDDPSTNAGRAFSANHVYTGGATADDIETSRSRADFDGTGNHTGQWVLSQTIEAFNSSANTVDALVGSRYVVQNKGGSTANRIDALRLEARNINSGSSAGTITGLTFNFMGSTNSSNAPTSFRAIELESSEFFNTGSDAYSIYDNSGLEAYFASDVTIDGDITTTDGIIGSMAVRDVFIDTGTPTGTDGTDGDIWLQYNP